MNLHKSSRKMFEKMQAEQGDIDLRNAQVIHGDNFVDGHVSSVTFNDSTLRFSSFCVRKFNGSDYVELLVHPRHKLLAIRPCAKSHKNAIRWTKYTDGRAYGRLIGCTAYIHTLYTLLDWQPSIKYRLRCSLQEIRNETVAVFDAKSQRKKNYYAAIGKQFLPASKKTEKVTAYNPATKFTPTPETVVRKKIIQLKQEMLQNGS